MKDNDLYRRCASASHVKDAGSFADGTVFGDWRLTAFIGRGGSGEVYCAEHTVLGMSAAGRRRDSCVKRKCSRS